MSFMWQTAAVHQGLLGLYNQCSFCRSASPRAESQANTQQKEALVRDDRTWRASGWQTFNENRNHSVLCSWE